MEVTFSNTWVTKANANYFNTVTNKVKICYRLVVMIVSIAIRTATEIGVLGVI